ncbi:hypothetical protein P4S72_16850 [Vibrio sp. PP-XX7]
MPQMTHCQQCRADAAGTLGGCSTPMPRRKPIRNRPVHIALQ